MKKILCSLLAIVFLINSKSIAGDREWAVAGKVLTGIAAVSIVQKIIEPQPVVVYQQQVLTQTQPVVVQQVVVQQVPVVYYTPVVVYRPMPIYHHHWVRH